MPNQSKIEEVKATYDEIGGQFSASRNYIWPDLVPFIAKVKPSSSVLDVGCGNGRLLLGLPQNIKYTGLDISQELLKEAKSAHPKHNFLEADITQEKTWINLPLFDHIFCVAVLHHLPTPKDQLFVLKQIKKHLKPKGKALITVWNLWQIKFLKHHFSLNSLNLKCKMYNAKCLYVPFQGTPRFCYAFTKTSLKRLILASKLDLKVEKTSHNYLLSN